MAHAISTALRKPFKCVILLMSLYVFFFALVFTLSVHHYHPFAPKCKLNRLILNDLSIMHCITIRVLLYEWLFSRECDLREDNKFVQNKNPRKMYVIRYLCTKLKCRVEAYYNVHFVYVYTCVIALMCI